MRNGFTLIELLVVLAVIAVIMSVLFIAGGEREGHYSILIDASNQLLTDLRYVRRMALVDGMNAGLRFHTQNNSYDVYFNSGSSDVVIRTVKLPDGIKIINLTATRFNYTPRGTPSAGYRVEIASLSHVSDITVGASGGRARAAVRRRNTT